MKKKLTKAEERRASKTDRRGADRQGKYDRRRNRCGSCAQFEPPAKSGSSREQKGFCRVHKKPFTADDFACVKYEPKD